MWFLLWLIFLEFVGQFALTAEKAGFEWVVWGRFCRCLYDGLSEGSRFRIVGDVGRCGQGRRERDLVVVVWL